MPSITPCNLSIFQVFFSFLEGHFSKVRRVKKRYLYRPIVPIEKVKKLRYISFSKIFLNKAPKFMRFLVYDLEKMGIIYVEAFLKSCAHIKNL